MAVHPVLLNNITEKAFLAQVVQAARLYKWMVYHTFNSMHSERGYPDLTLCKPGHGVLFIELKTERGRVSSSQQQWLDALQASGAEVYVWRPSQLDDIISRLQQ